MFQLGAVYYIAAVSLYCNKISVLPVEVVYTICKNHIFAVALAGEWRRVETSVERFCSNHCLAAIEGCFPDKRAVKGVELAKVGVCTVSAVDLTAGIYVASAVFLA